MEEAEQLLVSKEDRLKNGTDPPDGAVRKFSTKIRNGDGNMMDEVESYGGEVNSFEELKGAVEVKSLGGLKDGEDEKNLKEVKDLGERNSVKQIKNGEEDKDEEKEEMEAMNGEEREVGDSRDREEKKNLEKIKDEEKKEVKVHNGDEMKFVVEGKEGEVNRVLERVEDARDVKDSDEKYGIGDVEAIGGKSKEVDINPVDDIYVKEPKNGTDEEDAEGIKYDEHSKSTNCGKDEDIILVQGEDNDEGKARIEAKDVEMMGIEDVEKKEAFDEKDEGKVVVREREEEKDNDGNANKVVGSNEKAESLKRKRSIGRRTSETSEAKKNGGTKEKVEEEEEETKVSRKRSKEVLGTPVVSSSDRPVRERKIVERLVEVVEKGPNTTVIIEKGHGNPLREIPNVAYNLARKKPAELKLLHQTLFGRKGKALDFKSNLLQFSGFAWHESEEKQRTKIKEKLDKCVKESLLELCDLFDLTVSKTSTKKDEIIVKLLDFLEAPKGMSDVIHAEKQSSKSRKRERAPIVDASKSSGGNLKKRFKQRQDKTEGTPNSDVKSSHDTKYDDEDEDSEEGEDEDSEEEEDGDKDSEKQSQKEDDIHSHSESDAVEKELEETGDEKKDESKVVADRRKGKKVNKSPKLKEKKNVKNSKKQVSPITVQRKIGSNSKKSSPKTDGKSTLKTPLAKHSNVEKSNDTDEKTMSRKKKDAESPKKLNSKSSSKEKSSGKAIKGKAKSRKVQKSGPTKEELRKSICEILKEVDFNTATFTDILAQLASEYKTDLTPRKAAIKLLIQDELTKMADEEDSQDEEELQ